MENEDSRKYRHDFVEATFKKLKEEEKGVCEREITEEELLVALKSMANNKTPGTDGFQADFLKFFWRDLGHFLWRSLTCGFKEGKLSNTQCQGIISLPKGDKPRQLKKKLAPNITIKHGL